MISTDRSQQQDWIARKGNSNDITFRFLFNSLAYNISNITFGLYVFRIGSDTSNLANALITRTQGSGLTNNGILGTLNAAMPKTLYDALLPDQYVWILRLTLADGSIIDAFNGQKTLQQELYAGETTTTVTSSINLGGVTVDCDISLLLPANAWADAGTFAPTDDVFPADGTGLGPSGAILAYNNFKSTVGATFGGNYYPAGALFIPTSNSPGQDSTKWRIL